jgi:hypothetical protein
MRQCEAAYGKCQFFSVNQITVLPHAKYSSDATLRFFPLFPRLNCALKGHGHADIQGVQMTMKKKLCSVPDNAFQYCFKDLQKYCKW